MDHSGIGVFVPGIERFHVPACGSVVIDVEQGDHITLTDPEGWQACELLFVDPSGRFDATALGSTDSTSAEGLKAMLVEQNESALHTLRALARRHADISQAAAIKVFGNASAAGKSMAFVVSRSGSIVVAAPGETMDFSLQNTATPIDMIITRTGVDASAMPDLPEPLADPLQDFRIKAATASAYVVRAGQYIQVIDVAGRQCSDFQAFAKHKVDLGSHQALDATVTRTMLGRAYPTPGLPSKAFDLDMEPLLEVIRDTCGRHDTFATACNARYYDDMGYPGHVNCSDNFNEVLAPFGIAPRKSWEALNFFYNTNVDHQNQIYLDEPWSRPGDYVLMRALTDLVCVSSSCPDDIDPANGWNPTDIHIRTYADTEKFSIAMAYRMTPQAEPRLTRETAFHSRFSALTRNFTEYRGFWLPRHFNNYGPIAEYWACRERAVIIDLSPLRKFEVTGPDAEALLQYCLTRDVSKLSTGQVVYSAMCYENGGMIDDGTLFRLGQNNFRWIGGDDQSGIWLRQQAEKMGYKAWVRSSTDQMHNIALQGPKSRDILKEIIWTAATQPAIGELEWFRFAVARIGHFEGVPVVVSRTGYTGELGYELFCHPKDASAVFDAVWEAGKKYGIAPMGLDALDMVRIEAGLIFAGYEFSDQTDPFEAGIGFTVPLKSKAADFIGKEALRERKEHPRYKLVGLEIDSNDSVAHGDCIHVGRAQVGIVTSSTRSPVLGKNIALARMEVTHSEIGMEVEIGKLDGHQKRLPARIVKFAHYDPEKTKPRS